VDDALARSPDTQGNPLAPDSARTRFRLAPATPGRGVITTATYAARQFGVGSAMGMMKAAKLCPQAILLPVDFDQYRRYSRASRPSSPTSRR
jgi:DNA polymerase-4